jgi:hypothetical protein
MNCRFFAHTAMMMLVLTGTAEAQEAYLDVILPHGAGRPTPSGDALAVPHSSSDSWNIGCRITGGLYGADISADGYLEWRNLSTGQALGNDY